VPEFGLGEYGIVGITILVIGWIAVKAMEYRQSKQSDPSTTQAFAELSKAINELTQFLKEEKAVQKQVNRATEKALDGIVKMLEEILKNQNIHHDTFAMHANNCKLICQNNK
jgi:hypothetical protein